MSTPTLPHFFHNSYSTSLPCPVAESLEKPKPAEKAPEFVLKLQDRAADLKERVQLECRVEGLPAPEVAWFKGQVPLAQSGSPARAESRPDGTQLLIFESVDMNSQDTYKCVATNSAGQASTQATLGVKGEQRASREGS